MEPKTDQLELKSEYLGDGVYASFDGYYIWLDLRGQDDFTRIGLEPRVLARFDDYRNRINQALKEQTTDGTEHEPTE